MTATIMAWPERTDRLGRVIPGASVDELLAVRERWTPRHVLDIMAAINGPDTAAARRAVVDAAREVGITHYPADLAGRRCPITA